MKKTMSFNPDTAQKHGLNATLVLSFFEEVFADRKDADERFIFRDNGGCYIRLTYEEIRDKLPFLSVYQVRESIKKLVKAGELEAIKSVLHAMDHTKMYRLPNAPFYPGTSDSF